MSEILELGIIVIASIIVGILAGNGAVYVFNKLPASWFCDYGEKPKGQLLDKDRQRINSHPWKYVFTAMFIVVAIYMGMKDYQYAVAGIFALWLLLLIGIADKKYMIIPDQLIMLLAITGFGFIPFNDKPLNLLWGALIGVGAMVIVALIGKLIFKKETLGFGDAKLCGAMGLILGPLGIIYVMVAGSLIAGIVAAIGLITKKLKKDQEMPLAPYLCLAGAIYIVILN